MNLKSEPLGMANYFLVASDIVPFDGPRIKAPDVFALMMDNECWELTERSPHQGAMAKGDTFVFYLGGNQGRYIAGEAKLAGDFEPIAAKCKRTFDRSQVPFYTLRVPLSDIVRYEPKLLTIDTVAELSFAKDSPVERKYIGLLLRNGVRKLTDEDVALIRGRALGAGAAKN